MLSLRQVNSRPCTSGRRCYARPTVNVRAASKTPVDVHRVAIAVDPLAQPPPQAQCNSWVPTAASLAISVIVASYLLKSRVKRAAVREQAPERDLVVRPGSDDPHHHQRVLAKTRQVAHIVNAVAFQKAGEITKALLELNKALVANSVCRTPALVSLSKENLHRLYCLHLTHTEQPPNYATLLQLQEMLGLSQQEAEKLEVEVLSSPASFAI